MDLDVLTNGMSSMYANNYDCLNLKLLVCNNYMQGQYDLWLVHERKIFLKKFKLVKTE